MKIPLKFNTTLMNESRILWLSIIAMLVVISTIQWKTVIVMNVMIKLNYDAKL